LLHGRGADETDLIDLADRLPRHLTYASVRAPVGVEGGGYTWFENRGPARPISASVLRSVADFRAWLDRPGVALGRTCYLLGFSAGMMMAGALLIDDPKRFAGGVLLSGALALDAMPQLAVPQRLAGVPIFYGRGDEDRVIPPDLVRRADRYLREASGADVAFHAYAHAHEISNREVDDIAAWLAERA
jgi:phospholipase/carboxylesterase